MSRLNWIVAGVASLVAAGVCAAAEGHGGDEEISLFSGGMVTSFFTVLIFVLLLVVLGKYAWGPLLNGLKNREDRIRNDLQSARTERQEAERLLAEYKTQLAKAQAEAEEMFKKTAAEAERSREKILAQGQEQAKNLVEQARQQIDQAKHQALKDLVAQSADLAGDLAAKILGREVNAEDHRVLIQQGLDALGKKK